MKKKLDEYRYICCDCAYDLGGIDVPGHTCTMHTGKCDCCGEEKTLMNMGDWDWPDGMARGMRD